MLSSLFPEMETVFLSIMANFPTLGLSWMGWCSLAFWGFFWTARRTSLLSPANGSFFFFFFFGGFSSWLPGNLFPGELVRLFRGSGAFFFTDLTRGIFEIFLHTLQVKTYWKCNKFILKEIIREKTYCRIEVLVRQFSGDSPELGIFLVSIVLYYESLCSHF